MKKNLAYFILLVIGLVSSLTITINAQSAVSSDSKLTQTTAEDNSLQNYIRISSLPMNQRPKAFSDLSAEDKANLFKLHLALQFFRRPNLTKEQKNVILEGISMITSDNYNRESPEKRAKAQQDASLLEQKAKATFPGKDGFEIFANLSGSQEDIEMLQKYVNIVAISTIAETKKSFEQSSSVDKNNLWKVQMAYYLAKDEELNKLQKEFILRMIDFVSPQMFEMSKGSPERAKKEEIIKSLREEADNLFSEKKVMKIFGNLGPSGKTLSNPSPDNANANCTCRMGWTTCSSGYACANGGCVPTDSGCGFFWYYECNGDCLRCIGC